MIRSILSASAKLLKSSLAGNTLRRRKHNPQYAESFEVRVLPAAVNVMLTTNALGQSNVTITGSAQADSFQFTDGGPPGAVVVNSPAGTTFRLGGVGAPVAAFTFTPWQTITLRLGAGNDRVEFLTSLPQILIEDGVAAAETNSYSVHSYSLPRTIGGFSAVIDQGACQFDIVSSSSLDIGNVNLTYLRTTRSTVYFDAGPEDDLNVTGDVTVNSMGAVSQDTIGFRGIPNAKFDQQNDANLKLLGSFTANLGGGADGVEFRGTVAVSGTLHIDTGAGNDAVTLKARTLGADGSNAVGVVSPTFRGNVTILTGSGDDSVVVFSAENQLRIRFYREVKVHTGDGVDVVSVRLAEVRGKSDFDLGNGGAGANPASESVILDQTEFFGTNRVSIHGQGLLQVTGKGFFPARFRDAATFVIGANNLARNASNFVAIGSADPASRVVFHKSLWIFGIYTAHPVNAAFRGFVRLDPALKYLTNTIEI